MTLIRRSEQFPFIHYFLILYFSFVGWDVMYQLQISYETEFLKSVKRKPKNLPIQKQIDGLS